MANDFKAFATSVRARFDEMSTNSLFSVAIDNDAIWAAYLAAFPAGSDPIIVRIPNIFARAAATSFARSATSLRSKTAL